MTRRAKSKWPGVAFVALGIAGFLLIGPSRSRAQSSGQVGSWSALLSWPAVAVHAMLLPTGNVLTWSDYTDNGGAEIWRPATNTFTPVPYTLLNLFCAGHTYLPDGRVLIAGGIAAGFGGSGGNDDIGPRDTTIFDPVTERWSQGSFMTLGRYYPTTTTLGDGRILVLGGTTTCTSCVADIPEIYDPVTNLWESLAGRKLFQYYPHPYQLPDGRVLVAAQDDRAISSSVLNLETEQWTTVDSRILDGHSSVMFQPGKILKAGTATADNPGHPTAATSYTLDMTQTTPAPTWQSAGLMAYPRAYLNLTVLPDGQVLATGGSTLTDLANNSAAVYAAELWSPISRTWTTLASAQIPRLYHSTALLLPDGRVLVAGGGRQNGNHSADGVDPKDQRNAEIFSPPYLFKGARPVISSAPAVIQYGSEFPVDTPDAAGVASVSLIGLGAVTHAFNQNQRFVPLAFDRGGSALTVHAPVDGNTAPPGPYMLFLVNSNGVPSVAAMVRLPAPWEDRQPPTAPGNLRATASTGAISLRWDASTDDRGVSSYNVYRSAVSGFTPSPSNRIGQTSATAYLDTNLTAVGTYYYRVSAQDAVANVSSPSNEAFATLTALDTTSPTISMVAPAPGSTVNRVVTVSASAADDVTIAGVQFLLDGAPLGPELSGPGPTFSTSWFTTQSSNGPHTLSARARDGAGHTMLATSIGVTVSNAAPVAVDAVGPGAGGASVANGSSLSWSHTVTTTGANPLLTVGVAVGRNPDTGTSLVVSYNGVAMTSAGIVHANGATAGYVQLFYLPAPAPGAHTVQVTLSGGTASIEGGSVSFTGVNQTTPIRNIATTFGAGTSPRVSVTSAPGDMVVDAMVTGRKGTITSSQTLRWLKQLNSSTAGGNGAQSTAAGAASVTMGYTVPSDKWGMIGMDVVAHP